MNPLTNVKNITKLNEQEIKLGVNEKSSWHNQYKDSAWLFIGGLPFALTEGDIICVFSQYGEIVNINLIRDKKTGTSRGFCFLCYENQKSTILAVDNFNGIKLCGRTIRVDHVANYKPPKEHESDSDMLQFLHKEGCAPRLAPDVETTTMVPKADKERKRHKKEKKKKSKHKKHSRSSSESSSPESTKRVKIKKEDIEPEYSKNGRNPSHSHADTRSSLASSASRSVQKTHHYVHKPHK